jgi:hypothetical protein
MSKDSTTDLVCIHCHAHLMRHPDDGHLLDKAKGIFGFLCLKSPVSGPHEISE